METPRCLADRIGFYIESVMWKFKTRDGIRLIPLSTIHRARAIYKALRGDLILNGKNPRMVAGAIIYIAGLDTAANITQYEIKMNLSVSPDHLRKMVPYLKTYIKKQGI